MDVIYAIQVDVLPRLMDFYLNTDMKLRKIANEILIDDIPALTTEAPPH
jgi:hypothetical protein